MMGAANSRCSSDMYLSRAMDESAAVGEKKAFSFPLKMYTTINSFRRGSWSFFTQFLDIAIKRSVPHRIPFLIKRCKQYKFESQQRQYLSINVSISNLPRFPITPEQPFFIPPIHS